jgi:hypothetical protein
MARHSTGLLLAVLVGTACLAGCRADMTKPAITLTNNLSSGMTKMADAANAGAAALQNKTAPLVNAAGGAVAAKLATANSVLGAAGAKLAPVAGLANGHIATANGVIDQINGKIASVQHKVENATAPLKATINTAVAGKINQARGALSSVNQHLTAAQVALNNAAKPVVDHVDAKLAPIQKVAEKVAASHMTYVQDGAGQAVAQANAALAAAQAAAAPFVGDVQNITATKYAKAQELADAAQKQVGRLLPPGLSEGLYTTGGYSKGFGGSGFRGFQGAGCTVSPGALAAAALTHQTAYGDAQLPRL